MEDFCTTIHLEVKIPVENLYDRVIGHFEDLDNVEEAIEDDVYVKYVVAHAAYTIAPEDMCKYRIESLEDDIEDWVENLIPEIQKRLAEDLL